MSYLVRFQGQKTNGINTRKKSKRKPIKKIITAIIIRFPSGDDKKFIRLVTLF